MTFVCVFDKFDVDITAFVMRREGMVGSEMGIFVGLFVVVILDESSQSSWCKMMDRSAILTLGAIRETSCAVKIRARISFVQYRFSE